LSWLEGYRSFPTALRAGRHGLGFGKTAPAGTLTLVLTRLTPLGFVLEILVVEEVLLSRCEYEICAAVNAL
jgi:hypothetical protein